MNLFAVGGVLSGSGTVGGPYLIEDYEDLLKVNDDLGAHYEMTQDIDAGGQGVIIAILDEFRGTFDGGNHKIHNFSLSPDKYASGLFYMVSDTAIIKNLGVKGFVSGHRTVGMLTAINKGRIINCYSMGVVEAYGYELPGGLVGDNDGRIERSFSITQNNSRGGGLVGNNSGEIVQSYAGGSINSGGGLVGMDTDGIIRDSYAYTVIQSESECNVDKCGGLIRAARSSTIINSYSYGRVPRNSGGLLGFTMGTLVVENCYWDIERSGVLTSAGQDGVSYKGLTSSEMRDVNNFKNWNFTTIWNNDHGGFPALIHLENPPEGINDISSSISDTLNLNAFLVNDIDYENHTITEVRSTGYSVRNDSRDSLYFMYIPGEILQNGDTLWGAEAKLVVPFDQKNISTYQDLKKIGVHEDYPLDGYYNLINDIDARNSKSENGGEGFIPIGTIQSPFTGTLNGNGYHIFNFNIDRQFEDNIGLIGVAGEESWIVDVGVIGKVKGRDHVGILAGKNAGQIDRVYTHGITEGAKYTGGVIGSNENNGTICLNEIYSSATVNNFDVSGSAGGIIGLGISYTCLENSYSTGYITSETFIDSRGVNTYSGGLSGGKTYFGYASNRNNFFNGIIESNERRVSPIGAINYSDSNSYWNSETTWDYFDADESHCRGLQFGELVEKENFNNFDFINTWDINTSTSPFLRNVPNGPVGVPDVLDSIPSLNDFKQFINNDISLLNDTISEAQYSGKYKLNSVKDSIYLFYRPGILSGIDDTIWGGVTYVACPFDTIDLLSYTELKHIGINHKYPIDGIYRLKNNIDAVQSKNEYFSPIGTFNTPFQGVFIGNNFGIRNLYINKPLNDNVGLFGVIDENAIVKNLKVEIEFNGEIISSRNNIGGVAGTNKGLIEGVSVEVNISGKANSEYIGGVVGYNSGQVRNVVAKGQIEGGRYLGGLVGGNNGVLEKCISQVRVMGDSYIGGLVGKTNYGFSDSISVIEDCYNSGSIEGRYSVGGAVGYASDTIRNVYSVGSVIGGGGLIGSAYYDVVIEDCYWAIDASGQSTSDGDGTNYEGVTEENMKNISLFENWNFQYIWRMSNGDTYPALRNVINPPTAIIDNDLTFGTIGISGKTKINGILKNDVNGQTFTRPTFFKFDSVLNNGTTDSLSWYLFDEGDSIGTKDTVVYRSGINFNSDTLWSNQSFAVFIKQKNYKPDAVNDAYIIQEDIELSVLISELLQNDTDHISIIEFEKVISGELINATHRIENETLIISPDEHWNGELLVKHIITDGELKDTAEIVITVQPVNDPTIFTAIQPKTIDEDSDITLTQQITDVLNVDDDNLTFLIQKGDNYTVSGTTIIPSHNFNGNLTIPVSVDDGTDIIGPVDFKLTVTPINDLPTLSLAHNQIIDEDGLIELTSLMTDAKDDDNDPLQVVIEPHKDVVITDAIVEPVENFHGTIQLQIAITDGTETTSYVPMELIINSVNDKPDFKKVDSITTVEEVGIDISTIMYEATDVEGDNLSLIVLSDSSYVLRNDSILPHEHFFGALSVPVCVSDGTDRSDTIQLHIQVDAVDDPLTFSKVDNKEIDEDAPLEITLSMTDAVDVDDPLSVIISSGANYTIVDNVITPTLHFNGELSVPVAITNGRDTIKNISMTVVVAPVNDVPQVLLPKSQKINEDTPIVFTKDMVTLLDVDNENLNILVGHGEHYTVSGLTVTPESNYNGALQVPVSATDGIDTSQSVLLSVDVMPVNDAPYIESIAPLSIGPQTTIAVADTLIKAVDADGDALSVLIGFSDYFTAYGTNVIAQDGFTGRLAIPIQVTDGLAVSETDTLVVQVIDNSISLSSAQGGSAVSSTQIDVPVTVPQPERGDTTLIALPNPVDSISPITYGNTLIDDQRKMVIVNNSAGALTEFSIPDDVEECSIFTLRGELVSQLNVDAASVSIPLHLDAGVYVLKFTY